MDVLWSGTGTFLKLGTPSILIPKNGKYAFRAGIPAGSGFDKALIFKKRFTARKARFWHGV
jgi:hypothetical protein